MAASASQPTEIKNFAMLFPAFREILDANKPTV
jgi:hypothetical protein